MSAFNILYFITFPHQMKRISAILLVSLTLWSCGNKQADHKTADKRAAWIESLRDSVNMLRNQQKAMSDELDSLNSVIDNTLKSFDRIDNPRHVEGFTIYKGWTQRYPLKSTGVVARMPKNGTFELIAALSGGNFQKLRVVAPDGRSAETATVAHDQALNYRAAGLNTVAFTGPEAEAAGAFIAENPGAKIEFLNPGRSGSHTVSAAEREMIAATLRLTSAIRRTLIIEKTMPILQEKIKIYDQKTGIHDSAEQNEGE